MNNYQIIRPDVILSNMMDNVEVVKQMIGLYLSQGVLDFQNLKQAVQSENLTDIKSLAHHIKPTMEYIGATELRLKFQELEDLTVVNASLNDINAHFQDLNQDFETAMEELKNYLTTLA